MKKNKIINSIFNMIFLISIVSFSFIFTICSKDGLSTRPYVLISLTISTIFGIYILKKLNIVDFIKQNSRLEKAVILFFTVLYFLEIQKNFDLNLASTIVLKVINKFNLFNIVSISVKILAIPFIYFALTFIYNVVIKYIISFIKSFNKEEYNFFKRVFIILGIIILVVYGSTDKFGTMYDKMFSMDSGYVTGKMIYDIFWALDIRHILFAQLISHLKILTNLFGLLFPSTINLYYIIIALFNVFLLLIMSIMLKRLTNNKWIPYIFMASYPCLIYNIVIEKYIFCIFFVILLIYEKYYNKSKDDKIEDVALISSVGNMSTSAVIGFLYGDGKFIERFKRWIKAALVFICICAVCGKIKMIIDIPMQLDIIFGKISNVKLINKFNGVTELFYSFFFIPKYEFESSTIIFSNRALYLNYIGIIFMILTISGYIIKRKDKFTNVCFYWFVFLLALFIGANWYCHEAPLFNIYFSWAIIPLIINNIEIIKNTKIKNYIYVSLIAILLLVNIPAIIEIYNFVLKMA